MAQVRSQVGGWGHQGPQTAHGSVESNELDAHAEFVFDGSQTPGTAFDRAAAGAAGQRHFGGREAEEHFRVLFDFKAADATELTITKGDPLVITGEGRRDDGWIMVRCPNSGAEGFVPTQYVKQVPAPGNGMNVLGPRHAPPQPPLGAQGGGYGGYGAGMQEAQGFPQREGQASLYESHSTGALDHALNGAHAQHRGSGNGRNMSLADRGADWEARRRAKLERKKKEQMRRETGAADSGAFQPKTTKQRRAEFLRKSRADRAKREHEQQQHSDPQDAARISSLANRNNRNGADEGAARQSAPNTRKGPKRLTMAERNAQWKEKRDAKLERMRQKGKEKESGAPPPSGGRFNGKQPDGPGHSGNGNGALASGHGGSPNENAGPAQNVQGGYDYGEQQYASQEQRHDERYRVGGARGMQPPPQQQPPPPQQQQYEGGFPSNAPVQRAQSRRSGRVKCCAECGRTADLEEDTDNPGVFYCVPCWTAYENGDAGAEQPQSGAQPQQAPMPSNASHQASIGAADGAGSTLQNAFEPEFQFEECTPYELPGRDNSDHHGHSLGDEGDNGAGGFDDTTVAPGGGGETRTCLDKRGARFKYRARFRASVNNWRTQQQRSLVASGRPQRAGAGVGQSQSQGNLKVFARKRPLFAHEAKRGQFDAVDAMPGGDQMMLHACLMHPDMRHMYLKHEAYPVDCAFGAKATDEQVYRVVAAPLVEAVANGGIGACFMYGQTGSGKTHTMTGIESHAFAHLFAAALVVARRHGYDPDSADVDTDSAPYVEVSYFELAGKKCFDLLTPSDLRKQRQQDEAGFVVDDGAASKRAKQPLNEVKLREDGTGAVRVRGGATPRARDARALASIVRRGKKQRSTQATRANADSSRSHAVLQLRLHVPAAEAARDAANPSPAEDVDGQLNPIVEKSPFGVLTLVDCAGSEWREDSLYHDKERQREGAAINVSLSALKDCIRARAESLRLGAEGGRRGSTVHVPYRNSNLTKVLMEAFERPDAKLAMVATLSPSATDNEHSASTLRTACTVACREANINDVTEEIGPCDGPAPTHGGGASAEPTPRTVADVVHPRKWSADRVMQWLRASNRGAFRLYAAAFQNVDGKTICSFSQKTFQVKCNDNADVATQMFDALRAEMQRIDKLQKDLRKDKRTLTQGQRDRDYWKKPLDHGQVNRTT